MAIMASQQEAARAFANAQASTSVIRLTGIPAATRRGALRPYRPGELCPHGRLATRFLFQEAECDINLRSGFRLADAQAAASWRVDFRWLSCRGSLVLGSLLSYPPVVVEQPEAFVKLDRRKAS